MVFDDPSTSQPNDFWLHPCDCLPQQWGTEWPADPIALENIPPTSNGSFIPEPFSIVSGLKRAGEWFLRPIYLFWYSVICRPRPCNAGQFACPSRQLLKGAKGIHFQSEAESMEPADCEDCGGAHLLYQSLSNIYDEPHIYVCRARSVYVHDY